MREGSRAELVDELALARNQTLRLISHLRPEQWQVPYLTTINPPLWELGHVGWFQEYWCHRWHAQREPLACLLSDGDVWFDSRQISHTERWSLPLPGLDGIRAYLVDVLDGTLDRLESAPATPEGLYFFRLALFHEQMHIEAMAYTWQTLGVPLGLPDQMPSFAANLRPNRVFKGGLWQLGSNPSKPFVFDNEKWAHPVLIEPFEIEMQPVTNAEYLQFVNDGGYRNSRWWDAAYFAQLQREGRGLPCYWREIDGRLQRRRFADWEAIPCHEAVVHVSAFEAEAYCRWAGKALPTEAQWEFAAHNSKEFQWGDCVWEWTGSPFQPFAGFSPDPYNEYSQTSFGSTRVVKGGSYLTPRALPHPKFRNFFDPNRSDMFVGFRAVSA